MSETDDLLADLTRRANAANQKTGSVKESDIEVEDIEAFLREQDGDDYVPPDDEDDSNRETSILPASQVDSDLKKTTKQKTATLPRDLETDQKDTPKSLQNDEKDGGASRDTIANASSGKREVPGVAPSAPLVPKEDPRTDRKKKTTAAKPVEGGRSKFLAFIWFMMKFAFFGLPVVAVAWVIGAWVGSWIATGWIIALIALGVEFFVALILLLIVKKGRYVWWLTGVSVVLTAAIVGFFPVITAESLVRHGHWPVSAVLDPMQVSDDNFVRKGANWVSGEVGKLLSPNSVSVVPLKLGSGDPLVAGAVPTSGTRGAETDQKTDQKDSDSAASNQAKGEETKQKMQDQKHE